MKCGFKPFATEGLTYAMVRLRRASCRRLGRRLGERQGLQLGCSVPVLDPGCAVDGAWVMMDGE